MRRVLLVEDDSELRNLLDLSLTPLGYEVLHAVDGLEALYQAQYHQPDLVVLDLMMPTASGDLVLGFIRSTESIKDTPVVVVSAHHDIANLAAQYEADAYLQKPFSLEVFRNLVQDIVDS